MAGRLSRALLTARWDTRLEMKLAEPGALRVLDTSTLLHLAHAAKADVSEATVDRWIADAMNAGRLARVSAACT